MIDSKTSIHTSIHGTSTRWFFQSCPLSSQRYIHPYTQCKPIPILPFPHEETLTCRKWCACSSPLPLQPHPSSYDDLLIDSTCVFHQPSPLTLARVHTYSPPSSFTAPQKVQSYATAPRLQSTRIYQPRNHVRREHC